MPWWGILLIVIGSLLVVFLILCIVITVITTKMGIEKCFRRYDVSLEDEARIERNAIIKNFFDDKEHREVIFKSFDDTLLTGYYVTRSEKNKKVAIVHHGLHSDHMDMTPYAQMYYDMGYDILLVDSRNCGKSQGKYVTFGVYEAKDLEKWIDQIVFMKGKDVEIILTGVSMGAVISTLTTQSESSKYVKAVIADCGYTTFNDEIEYSLKNEIITNNFLKKFSKFIVLLMNIGVRLYCGFNVRKSSPIEAVRKSQTPILFIHGTEDTLVPYFMMKELYDACISKKECVSFEGVVHAQSIKQIEKYQKCVSEFLNSLEK